MKELADKGEYKVMPVSTELLSDFITPMEVLRKLKNVSKHCYMLESAGQDMRWGRYTFLGFDPKLSITCIDGELKVGDVKIKTANPSEHIRQVLSEYKSVRFDNLPPFTGGLVGYFAFDYLGYSEPEAKRNPEDTEGFNDVDLMLFDKVIAFDNVCQKIVIIVNMMLKDGTAGYNKAVSVYRSAENFIAELNLKLKKLQVEMQSKYNNSDTEAKIKRISSRFEAVRKSFLEKASSLEKDNRQLENIAERNLDICGRLKSEARYTNPDTILTKEEGKALERAVTELKEAPEKEQAIVKINASFEKISSVLDDRKEARKEKTDDKIYKHKTDKEYGY
jgi:hypothetical protein